MIKECPTPGCPRIFVIPEGEHDITCPDCKAGFHVSFHQDRDKAWSRKAINHIKRLQKKMERHIKANEVEARTEVVGGSFEQEVSERSGMIGIRESYDDALTVMSHEAGRRKYGQEHKALCQVQYHIAQKFLYEGNGRFGFM